MEEEEEEVSEAGTARGGIEGKMREKAGEGGTGIKNVNFEKGGNPLPIDKREGKRKDKEGDREEERDN